MHCGKEWAQGLRDCEQQPNEEAVVEPILVVKLCGRDGATKSMGDCTRRSARQERERVSGNNVRTQTSERVVYTGRKGDRRKHLPVHTVPEASSGTAYSHV